MIFPANEKYDRTCESFTWNNFNTIRFNYELWILNYEL